MERTTTGFNDDKTMLSSFIKRLRRRIIPLGRKIYYHDSIQINPNTRGMPNTKMEFCVSEHAINYVSAEELTNENARLKSNTEKRIRFYALRFDSKHAASNKKKRLGNSIIMD